MYIKYNKNLKESSRELRRKSTKQEMRIWYDYLSKYPIRFQRQKPIAEYIVDFYCNSAKLIIEIDGFQHGEKMTYEYDQKRTKVLNDLGYKVIRVSNYDVNTNFEGVCKYINDVVCEILGNEKVWGDIK